MYSGNKVIWHMRQASKTALTLSICHRKASGAGSTAGGRLSSSSPPSPCGSAALWCHSTDWNWSWWNTVTELNVKLGYLLTLRARSRTLNGQSESSTWWSPVDQRWATASRSVCRTAPELPLRGRGGQGEQCFTIRPFKPSLSKGWAMWQRSDREDIINLSVHDFCQYF